LGKGTVKVVAFVFDGIWLRGSSHIMPRAKRTTPTLTRLLTVVFHRRAEEPVLHAVDTGRVRLGVSLGSLPVVAEVQERVPNGSELARSAGEYTSSYALLDDVNIIQ